jgi:uncharacterized protein (DUF934 family)
MRRIIRRLELLEDDVRYPGEELQPGTRRALPAALWLAAARAGQAGAADAVLLAPSDELEPLAAYLGGVGLIVVEFPRIGEGRGFSQARLLRVRLGYTGELRARGALKRDQLFFLARCGFDSFDLDPAEDLHAALAAFHSFSVAYQDGSDALVHVQRRSPAHAEPY